ncbi:MAG: efflux RND transporter periplasmic adaptor subunit [Hyphomicrobiaceae bacterium]
MIARNPTTRTRRDQNGPGASFRRAFAVSALCLTAVLAWSRVPAQAQNRASAVLVDRVEAREISDTQPVIGHIVANRRSGIAARVAGIVDAVTFEIGQRVKRGDVLVRLDKRRLEIALSAAEAAIGVAKAGIDVANAKAKRASMAFERQAGLKKSTAFSRSTYDDLEQAALQSQSERAQAEAQLRTAEASRDTARYNLDHAEIRAPFDGIVLQRSAHVGQYLQQGEKVATLLDPSSLEIEADVAAMVAMGLNSATRVAVTHEDGREAAAQVRVVVPLQSASTRTRLVRFTLTESGKTDGNLAVGSTVTLKLPVSAPRKVMTVPKDALLQGTQGWLVYVVKDNKAEARRVELGEAVSGRMEVVQGLSDGEIIVVRGNERLRPGQPVQTEPAPTAAAAGKG